jgi:pyruvate/2-oxoglutarate dehydrogenase complex dihydrolipoamide dehydrogenase (E3) component
MATRTFDNLIIGTGQSGPALAARLAAAGQSVCIVERKRFGGTCVNNGCTPTKTMVASAYVAHMARRAADYGVDFPGPVTVDMKRVKERKDAIVAKYSGGLESWLRSLDRVTVMKGHARFTSPNTVEVGEESLSAKSIFINTGGRSVKPPGLPRSDYLTSETVMDVDFLPEHLIIVGGSYIGLEFGQAFRRFGSRVTIVEKGPRLIGREDRDVSEGVRSILEAEGIEVRVDAKCISAARTAHGVAVSLACGEGAPTVEGSHVLFATGRMPNTDDLGLDKAGIRTDEHGFIVVDDALRSSVPGVYVLGDANGRGAFTHTSYNDYEIVADNLLNAAHRSVADRIPIYALFIDPPLGRVGMTMEQAKRGGAKVLVGKRPMTRVARAVERDETRGFMKVIVDAGSKRILGAAVLGASGDESVQTLVDAMGAGLSVDQVKHGVRIHPTVGELLPTVLGELREAGEADL